MAYWTEPLTKERIEELVKANEKNGPITMMDGPIGSMVKVECINPSKIYYCGGEGAPNLWLLEREFYNAYPEYDYSKPCLPDPEFDLEDMELAEIIMEELK